MHDEFSPNERLAEIARILAVGIHRLKQQAALSPETAPPRLDHCSQTGLSVVQAG